MGWGKWVGWVVCVLAAVIGACLELPAIDPLDAGVDTGADPQSNGFVESKLNGRRFLFTWGSPEEIGYAEGRLMCADITALVQKVIADNALRRLRDMFGANYESYDQLLLYIGFFADFTGDTGAQIEAMHRGMTENCRDDELTLEIRNEITGAVTPRLVREEDLRAANALFDFFGGCSSVAVSGVHTASGDTLYGRTFDFLSEGMDPDILKYQTLKFYGIREASGEYLRFVSVGFPGIVGCISCLSEGGFALNWNYVKSTESNFQGKGRDPLAQVTRGVFLAGAEDPLDPIGAAERHLGGIDPFVKSNLHVATSCPGGACQHSSVFEVDCFPTAEGDTLTRRSGGDDLYGVPAGALLATNHFRARIDHHSMDWSAEGVTPSSPEGREADAMRNSVARYDAIAAWLNDLPTFDGTTLTVDDIFVGLSKGRETRPDWTAYHTVIYDFGADRLDVAFADGQKVDAFVSAHDASKINHYQVLLAEFFAELPR